MRVCECVKEEEEWEVGRNNNCAISLQSLSNILDEVQVSPGGSYRGCLEGVGGGGGGG